MSASYHDSESIMFDILMIRIPDFLINGTVYYFGTTWTFVDSLDIDYIRWVLWVVYPIVISFLLPLLLLVFIYASALFLQIYKRRQYIRDALAHDLWSGARNTLAALWEGQGRIWHGYEVVGFEKIPSTGPAMLIYYHGAVPIDLYYLMAKCILEKGRNIHAVGDRFLFKIPGWNLLMVVFNVTIGTVQSCVDELNNGHILAIAPGGLRESLFGDEYYDVMWGKRIGFAKVAMQANVPVIPMFTRNCREALRTPSLGRYCMRWIYEKTRLPLVPIYGGFPVKIKTFVGDAIYPESFSKPEDLAKKIEDSLKNLITEHQPIPGSIFRALIERFGCKEKTS